MADASEPKGPPAGGDTAPLPPPLRRDPRAGFRAALLHGLYDGLWLVAILVGLPWLILRCTRAPGFRAMVRERLRSPAIQPPRPGDRPRVLIHGVSVGEIKAALPLVERLERDRPDLEVVLSTTTTTGQSVAKRLFPNRPVVRFPADLSLLVGPFLARVQPAAVVLMELEVWPNFLRASNRAGVPVAVVNGRITQRSFGRYRWFRGLAPQFDRISLFCAQSATYADRFAALVADPARVRITGNTKVDGLSVGRQSPGEELLRRLGPLRASPLLVAGSTHGGEELEVAEAWREARQGGGLVLAPRHPERCPDVETALLERGFAVDRLTALREADHSARAGAVLLADTIGELDRLYALADLAFVGGSLVPHGGQNVLEPAAQGVAVLTGPQVHNFRQEVALLEEAGALLRVADGSALRREFRRLLGDREAREAMGQRGLVAVASQRGAAEATWRVLCAFGVLPAPPTPGQPATATGGA